MNPLSAKKLLNSKWTTVSPINKDKHFIITEVEYDEEGMVMLCLIEAIMSKATQQIQWRELKDPAQWIQGWK